MTEDERMLAEGRDAGKKLVEGFHGDWKALATELNRQTEAEARRTFEPADRGLAAKIAKG